MDNRRYEIIDEEVVETKEYSAWIGMITRCYNKKTKGYKNYGGRGISMSKEWRDSFENFFNDMGVAPSKKHSVDRIDNNGPYSKENCRWATRKEQCRNRRSNISICNNGIKYSVADLVDKFNLEYARTRWRVRSGMSFEEIIKKEKRNERIVDGESISSTCRKNGICQSTYYRRIKRGMSHNDAIKQ